MHVMPRTPLPADAVAEDPEEAAAASSDTDCAQTTNNVVARNKIVVM